jgi:hypothetical protein
MSPISVLIKVVAAIAIFFNFFFYQSNVCIWTDDPSDRTYERERTRAREKLLERKRAPALKKQKKICKKKKSARAE